MSTKKCAECDILIMNKRSDCLYCSGNCRSIASKKRKEAKELSGVGLQSLKGLLEAKEKQQSQEATTEKAAPNKLTKLPVSKKTEIPEQAQEKKEQTKQEQPSKEQAATVRLSDMPMLRGFKDANGNTYEPPKPPPPPPVEPPPFTEQMPVVENPIFEDKITCFDNPEFKERLAFLETQKKKGLEFLAAAKVIETEFNRIKAGDGTEPSSYMLGAFIGAGTGRMMAENENKTLSSIVGGLLGIGLVRLVHHIGKDDFLKKRDKQLNDLKDRYASLMAMATKQNNYCGSLANELRYIAPYIEEQKKVQTNTQKIAKQQQALEGFQLHQAAALLKQQEYEKALKDYTQQYINVQNQTSQQTNQDTSQTQDKTIGVVSSKKLGERIGGAFVFNGVWKTLLGEVSREFQLVLHGPSGSGKSHLAIHLAKYLAEHHGEVLYNTSEEGFSRTMDMKLEKLQAKVDHLDIAVFENMSDFVQNIPPQKYNFIVLDSVNDMKMKGEDLRQLRKAFPHSAIIAICQNTKNGDIRGGYDFVHDADIKWRVEDGVVYTDKNRFIENKPQVNIFEIKPVPLERVPVSKPNKDKNPLPFGNNKVFNFSDKKYTDEGDTLFDELNFGTLI